MMTRSRMFFFVQLLTFSRLPLAIIFGAVLILLENATIGFALCLVTLIMIELSDVLDGMLSRRTGSVSKGGAILDPFFDSVSRLIVYATMAYVGLVLALVPLIMALRDITVAYARMFLIMNKRSASARISGKMKAVFQGTGSIVLILLALLGNREEIINLVVSWVIIGVTAVSAFEYVRAAFSSE